jgi:hypothetical protein
MKTILDIVQEFRQTDPPLTYLGQDESVAYGRFLEFEVVGHARRAPPQGPPGGSGGAISRGPHAPTHGVRGPIRRAHGCGHRSDRHPGGSAGRDPRVSGARSRAGRLQLAGPPRPTHGCR